MNDSHKNSDLGGAPSGSDPFTPVAEPPPTRGDLRTPDALHDKVKHPREAGLVLICTLVLVAVLLRPALTGLLDHPAAANWATVFVAIIVQALPFIVLGVAVSATIAAFVSPTAISRLLSRRPALAVPAAAAAGTALPGCECGSVPIAARLIASGLTPAAALAFLLSAPAINPVVLAATAVAFPNNPEMVLGRLLASLAASIAVGLAWYALGRDDLLTRVRSQPPGSGSKVTVFLATAQQDFLQTGGFLVVGAAAAATMQTLLPRAWLDSVAGSMVLSVLTLALLAILLCLCSQADAFVAVGLSQFSLSARLVFLVVGPMVDLKLIALQAGTFGSRFAWRFSLLTITFAVTAASLVGWWLL